MSEQPHLILLESTDHAVQHTTVVKHDKIALFPIMGTHVLKYDARSLQIVNNLSNLDQVINNLAVAVGFGCGVEAASQVSLGFRCEGVLALDTSSVLRNECFALEDQSLVSGWSSDI